MLQKGLFLYINPLNKYIGTNQVSLHQVKPTMLQNYIIITKTNTILLTKLPPYAICEWSFKSAGKSGQAQTRIN